MARMQGHLRIVACDSDGGLVSTIAVRSDVWDVRWAQDDHATAAVMEKSKLVILHDAEAEDPVRTNSHLSSFGSLEVNMIDMVALMTKPSVRAQCNMP